MSRKTRIGASVLFGISAVAMCALWVRSYWQHDMAVFVINSSFGLASSSVAGRVMAGGFVPNSGSPPERTWIFRTVDLPDWRQFRAKAERDMRVICGFGAAREKDNAYATVPHWFLVGLLAAIATLPWLTFRFSLRTMLFATTVIAVLLGMIVWSGR